MWVTEVTARRPHLLELTARARSSHIHWRVVRRPRVRISPFLVSMSSLALWMNCRGSLIVAILGILAKLALGLNLCRTQDNARFATLEGKYKRLDDICGLHVKHGYLDAGVTDGWDQEGLLDSLAPPGEGGDLPE